MPIITDPNKADAKLRSMCPPDVAPVLNSAEFQGLLDDNVQAGVWVAGTVYAPGDNPVIPITRNGHRYECVTGGTSGATEPAWGTADNATVTDGTVTWQEAGREIDLWDFRAAAEAGWRLKLAKSTACVDYQIEQNRFSRSQISDHCKEQMRLYAPIGIA